MHVSAEPHLYPPPLLVRRPELLLERRGEALSAGDVSAALSLSAPGAVVLPWHLPPASGDTLRQLLASLAAYKCPVRLSRLRCDAVDDVALLTGRWSLAGDVDGRPVQLAADVTAIARHCDEESPAWQLWLERWDAVP